MSEKKTLCFLSWNQDWKTVKAEIGKINGLLSNISTNNIMKLNHFIFTRAKLICGEIGVPPKPVWEITLETQARKLRQQAKILKEVKKMKC